MNKKLVPVVVILLLLAGAGYYLKTRQSGTGPAGQTTGQTMNEAAEFAKAMESGKPTVCTMAKGDDLMEYHIKGKLMRANITAKVEDKTTLSHMINDGAYLYMWSDDQKQGSKMAIPTDLPAEASAKEGEETKLAAPKLASQADYDSLKTEGYTINCKSGSVDDAVFTPPTNVKFIDPSEMMKAIPSPDANGKFDMSKLEELQKQYGGGAEY